MSDSRPLDQQANSQLDPHSLLQHYEMSTFDVVDDSQLSLLNDYANASFDSLSIQSDVQFDNWDSPIYCDELPAAEAAAEPIADPVAVPEAKSVEEANPASEINSVSEAVPEVDEALNANPELEANPKPAVCLDSALDLLGEPHDLVASLINPVKPLAVEVVERVVVVASEPKLKKLKKKNIAEVSVVDAIVTSAGEDEQLAAEKPKAEKTAEPTVGKTLGFGDLGLSGVVRQAVETSGYSEPTPIQAEIIPHMLSGRDLLAQSQTGTGKTAAFALPILSKLDMKANDGPKALVLAPTRELAIQVAKSFETYAEGLNRFNVTAIYGGQDYEIQFRQLRRGAHVVVGTPGRVIDHINRGTLDLSGIETLVLDEADEMLNMGFLEDVQFVLDQLPDKRQIALFSATLPGPVRDIAETYLNDPVKITIKKKTMTADSIRQRALFITPREKIDVLCRFLEIEETDGVIVFTKTKDATITVAEALNREGLSAVALNGDMPQKVRERAIEQLKSGRLNILVATDVAARGLDVKRISHVFNFDLPHDSESYIHRVGRTGRAGRAGEAIIFLTNAQRGKLRLIEKATKQPIEVVNPPSANDINAARIERFKQQITDVTSKRDLTIFKDLVVKYAEETGKPMEMIAAALAEITQQGRPFLVRDQPRKANNDRAFERDSERGDRGSRSERKSGREGGLESREKSFGDRPAKSNDRRLGPPEPGMQRYRIEVGHRDGVRPGNIVGAVANEAGIDGGSIGPIKILDSFSTIDLPEGLPRDLYQTLRNTWVVGKQLRISQYNAEGSSEGFEGRSGAKPGKFGKPKFGKSKFGSAGGGKPGGFNGKKSGKMKNQKARPE